MLKTLSAAVIAVSVLAAPAAFAGTTAQAPRAAHSHVLDAKAQMKRAPVHHRHHLKLHKKFSQRKAAFKHVAKHVTPSAKTVRKQG